MTSTAGKLDLAGQIGGIVLLAALAIWLLRQRRAGWRTLGLFLMVAWLYLVLLSPVGETAWSAINPALSRFNAAAGA